MLVGISIEKAVGFRGGTQPFANVYYYEAPAAQTDTAAWSDLIDKLVAIERPIHGSGVTFVRGRCWRADGTKAENIMIVDKQLTGSGTNTPSSTMDRERALLVQIRAGVDSKGRPVQLRKWFHVCASAYGGATFSDGALANTATLAAGQQSALAALGESLKSVPFGTGNALIGTLTAKSGRDITGASKAHPYLEHHQLGDQWRSV